MKFAPLMSFVARSGIHSHSPPHRHSHATGYDRRDSVLNLIQSGDQVENLFNTNDFCPKLLKMVKMESCNPFLNYSKFHARFKLQSLAPATRDSPKTHIAATIRVMESFSLFHHSYPQNPIKTGVKTSKA